MAKFEDVIGYEGIKKELYQIVDMFKSKEKYIKMGARLPKGVLIYGNPGMGKTLLATAFIDECKIPSFILRKNKTLAETLKEIRDTFVEAKKLETSIIFIDDIDKFSDDKMSDSDSEEFVAIQTCIDSVKNGNVLVIATANNYRKLPLSLRRTGRFDKKFEVKEPTSEESQAIIKHYLKNKNVSDKLNYEDLSKMINYYSCAALETLMNESAIIAAYANKESIELSDITAAYLSYQGNSDEGDNSNKFSQREIDTVALHECGHAAIMEVLKKGSVGFIHMSTGGRNNCQGFTQSCEDKFRRPELVVASLGGKAAVELLYEGRPGSGCSSDLNKAKKLLLEGTMYNGIRGLSLVESDSDFLPFSQRYIDSVEGAVNSELERLMFVAKDIILKNKEFVLKLSEELKTKQHLYYSDIQRIRDSVTITEVPIQ